jgi:8-oxo-dGTP diphosphatase
MIDRPKVGIGVLIVNVEGKVLVGRRKGSHAQYYSIPGGHLELGETFEEAAAKEIKEETGLEVIKPKVFCVTNNLRTYKKEGKHYVSVCLLVTKYNGVPINLEPEKCHGWIWADPHNLPQPHFDASENAVRCYLENSFS